MYLGFLEEGDKCPECKTGSVDWPEPEYCSCHVNPPCPSCTGRVLTCTECGWQDEPQEYKYVSAAPGLSIMQHRPRQLDSTKVDFRSKGHTSSSMIKEGVYPVGMEAKDVAREISGTFGGRFESFGNGKFKYIAYTD